MDYTTLDTITNEALQESVHLEMPMSARMRAVILQLSETDDELEAALADPVTTIKKETEQLRKATVQILESLELLKTERENTPLLALVFGFNAASDIMAQLTEITSLLPYQDDIEPTGDAPAEDTAEATPEGMLGELVEVIDELFTACNEVCDVIEDELARRGHPTLFPQQSQVPSQEA